MRKSTAFKLGAKGLRRRSLVSLTLVGVVIGLLASMVASFAISRQQAVEISQSSGGDRSITVRGSSNGELTCADLAQLRGLEHVEFVALDSEMPLQEVVDDSFFYGSSNPLQFGVSPSEVPAAGHAEVWNAPESDWEPSRVGTYEYWVSGSPTPVDLTIDRVHRLSSGTRHSEALMSAETQWGLMAGQGTAFAESCAAGQKVGSVDQLVVFAASPEDRPAAIEDLRGASYFYASDFDDSRGVFGADALSVAIALFLALGTVAALALAFVAAGKQVAHWGHQPGLLRTLEVPTATRVIWWAPQALMGLVMIAGAGAATAVISALAAAETLPEGFAALGMTAESAGEVAGSGYLWAVLVAEVLAAAVVFAARTARMVGAKLLSSTTGREDH